MHRTDQGHDSTASPIGPIWLKPVVPDFAITLLLAAIVIGEKLGSFLEALLKPTADCDEQSAVFG
jgi:hypothetical protein